MPSRRRMRTARAVRGRAAPDALVRARPMPVLARRAMRTPRAVARRPAPFAMPLVVSVLVLPRRTMRTTRTIARRIAMPASCAHVSGSLIIAIPNRLALLPRRRRIPHVRQPAQFRAQAFRFNFVPVHDGILQKRVRLLDLVDVLVSLHHRHCHIIIPHGASPSAEAPFLVRQYGII